MHFRIHQLSDMSITTRILIPVLCMFHVTLLAQEQELIAKVDQLFDAMRANDSMMVQGLFTDNATLSSVFTDSEGNKRKRTNPAQRFITAIGTPREDVWDEKIWSYDIQQDGDLAFVWTEYTFYLNNDLRHCGYNMFEMVRLSDDWQISAITDTRRRTDCQQDAKSEIENTISTWHQAAASADEETYFSLMTKDAVFIGTDPGERWTRDELKAWSADRFDSESAWTLDTKELQIMVDEEAGYGWFDELLDSWMGTCRGSGVVRKEEGQWLISHYHLSIAVPNDAVKDYLKLIEPKK